MNTTDALMSVLPVDAVAGEAPGLTRGGHPPEAVVRPGSDAEVIALMEWATREGVGVLPVASGRWTRPVRQNRRYVVLQTERLSGIEEYRAADLTVTAGAGTPMVTVATALGENSQWAPFDPPGLEQRSLGGLVSVGLSGPLATGYGELRNHVLGLTVVTGDGRRLRLGGRVVKNVAGFDVLKTVVGSRGTLAIITSVVLRAFPVPQVDRVLVLEAGSAADLLDVGLAVGTAPILPVSSVLVDHLPGAAARAALVVRLHGAEETVTADGRRLEAHVGASFHDGTDLDLGAVRDHAASGEPMVSASVLPSRLPQALAVLEELQPHALAIDTYGGRIRGTVPPEARARLAAARDRIEALGGALRVSDAESEDDGGAAGSKPAAGETTLIGGLRNAFDPAEVLWPARH